MTEHNFTQISRNMGVYPTGERGTIEGREVSIYVVEFPAHHHIRIPFQVSEIEALEHIEQAKILLGGAVYQSAIALMGLVKRDILSYGKALSDRLSGRERKIDIAPELTITSNLSLS